MAETENFVILGASHAGVQLAASLRETGYEGVITLVGEETHTPYHRPPLSKAYLKDDELDVQVLRAEAYFTDNDIDFRPGCRAIGVEVDKRLVELDKGRPLNFSKLCFATGARPRALNIPGIDAKGVFQLRDADDAALLRTAARNHKKAVVVGGGFIGLETAATLRALGMEVSVVEAAPRLMGRAVAPQISEFVLQRLRQLGIKIFLDMPIEEVLNENNKVTGVSCGTHRFEADMVLIGIGVVPNEELAGEAGLTVGNGIHVDQQMKTSIDSIYAIGDVAAYQHWMVDRRIRLESVQNAADQARHLAGVIAGSTEPYRAMPWFWSEQADMKLQMVGLSHNSQHTVSRENPERDAMSVFHFDEAENLLAIDTINAPADHMAGRKLLARGVSPSLEQAADVEFSLKQLL